LPNIDLLLTPNLRTSSMKVSQILQEKGDRYEVLLLNFSEEIEDRVVKLAAEQVSYDELIDEVNPTSQSSAMEAEKTSSLPLMLQ
jgi:hypothetical protein